MMVDSALLTQLGSAVAIVSGFLIVGYIVEKFILAQLKKFADVTQWECDEVIVCALRGRMQRWSFLGGVYVAVLAVPLPHNLTGLLRNVLIVLFILSVTTAASDIAVGIINIYAKKSTRVFPSTSIFTNLTISVLFIIGLLIIMQSLGISITPLLTALGVGGLAVALALQDTLSNFFAGLHILFSRPIRPGDYIRLDTGEAGYVVDITWRNTSMKDLFENMIVVPNSKMAAAKVVNYALPAKETIIIVPISIGYGSDLEHVEQITSQVAQEVMVKVPGGVQDYVPLIRFHSFGEYSIQLNVILCVHEYAAQYFVKHEFIKRLHKRYRTEGITFPIPVQTVYLRKDAEYRKM